jgi:DNA-directed RNA polymerase specialized sigma24 family protein
MPETLLGGNQPNVGGVVGPGSTEEELMSRAAIQDDGLAFDALTKRWTPILMRYFYPRKTPKKQDASDMTQEALLRIWRYRTSWIEWSQSGGTFPPWMYTIAHRVFLNWNEAVQKDPIDVAAKDASNLNAEDPIDPLRWVAQPGPSLAEWAECTEFWEAIRACVDALDAEVQKILGLWIWEEASHTEIRDRLWPNRSDGAARRYVNRRGGAALGSLRRCLQRKGFDIPNHEASRLDPPSHGGNR